MANKGDFRAMIRTAEKAGWTVVPTRNGHLKWVSPNGGTPVFSASTPSDKRAIKNHVALLRRSGLAV